MSNPELALQKLNELREVAPEEVGEVIDGLATLLVLRQDVSNPMIGAKVVYHSRPPAENEVVKPDEVPDDTYYTSEFEKDGEKFVRYRKKLNENDPDIISQRAIVFEAGIAGLGSEELWDPNRRQYQTGDDYPLGTVNIVLPDDPYDQLGEDYTYKMRVETSVTPAKGEPGYHEYTPGWE